MRFFTVQNMAEKWLESPEIENKIEGIFHMDVKCGDMVKDKNWKGRIRKKEFEKRLIVEFAFESKIDAFTSNQVTMEVNFMRSASRTEFCTDIHVILKGFCDTEEGRMLRDGLAEYWRQRLEVLRALVNGNWVIGDNDLSHSSLLGSRL